MICARSSTACAGSCALAPRSGTCPTISHTGVPTTNRPTAAIFDSRTLEASNEEDDTGGYDGHEQRTGRKPHLAVNTLGEFLALVVTPANEQDRAQVTGDCVEVAFVGQGYISWEPELAAAGWVV